MKPNILFLCLDSFTAIKCFGKNKTSKTPNIDSLIEKGVLFKQAISSADGTELCWASIFTSKYPFQIGLNSKKRSKISSKTANYFNLLRENGYHTYATMPSGSTIYGLTKNFENSDIDYDADFRLYDGLDKQILNKFQPNNMLEPWIYFIHLLDWHLPISLPSKFENEKYGDNKFDKMVSAIDVWIGRILEKIKLENTLVVLTADHGEFIPSINYNGKIISNFGNETMHNLLWKIEANLPSQLIPIRNKLFDTGRKIIKQNEAKKIFDLDIKPYEKRALLNNRNDPDGYLFDELVHVPLIFSGNGLKPKIITNMVRHVDVFPTLVELMNYPPMKEKIEGQSLTPLLDDKPLEELPVFMEGRNRIEKDESCSVIGVRTSKYKYFKGRDKTRKRVFLFDLENDPLEEKNIKEENPEIIEKMEVILEDFDKKSLPVEEQEELTNEETKKIEKELRKLGYI